MADAALEGAQAYGQSQENLNNALINQRRTAAYNALSQIYGPQVGDPETWMKATAASKAEAELPYAGPQAAANVAETQAKTAYQNALTPGAAAAQASETESRLAGAAQTRQTTSLTGNEAQRQAGYRAVQMLSAATNPDGSISPDVFDRVVGDGTLLGIDPAHMPQLKELLTKPGAGAHLDTIGRALIGPTNVTGQPVVARGPNGESILVRSDKYGNPIEQPLGQGVTPVTQQRADTAQAAQSEKAAQDVATRTHMQNQDVTAGFRAGTAANNTAFGNPSGAPAPAVATIPGQHPVPAAQRGLPPAGAPAAAPPAAPPAPAAPAAPQVGGPTPNGQALLNRIPPKGRGMIASAAKQISDQNSQLATTHSVLDQIDKMAGPYSLGAGSWLTAFRGNDATDIKANLATLRSQGLTLWLQSMKNAQGQTGIGRVLQAEANAAMASFGALEQDQRPQQFFQHLKLFRTQIDALAQHQRTAFKAQWGVDPEDITGPTPEQAQAELARRRGGR